MKKFIVLMLVSVMMVGVLAGCAGNESVSNDVELSEIHEAVKAELGESYFPDRDMELQEVMDYTGLNEEQVEEFIAQAPMMNVGVDTFIAIKATEGNGDAVYEGLEAYRTYLVEESFQYPMNMPKVNAAKAVQYGDYAFFIMLGGYDDTIDDIESDEAREFAESEVERVEKVIEEFFK
ncbi:DUF4358 domain-containing protein [Tissierella sp. Yu-01]|uniref:DUF4358 domain-containing protein n=1 Tax=Tissierella sp. Yu-01 TaxID=3035694 RepID=UPI00240DD860|nr:DUF4358 domain-containing protein [Tissierella sp. Yu-01]WFA07776.1 DUF4358 domain-containing protein [Tissierella sp. Yu-01]